MKHERSIARFAEIVGVGTIRKTKVKQTWVWRISARVSVHHVLTGLVNHGLLTKLGEALLGLDFLDLAGQGHQGKVGSEEWHDACLKHYARMRWLKWNDTHGSE